MLTSNKQRQLISNTCPSNRQALQLRVASKWHLEQFPVLSFSVSANLQGNPAAFCLAATNGFSQVTLTSLGKHLPITNQIGKICLGWVFMVMKWALSLDEINPRKSTSSQSRTLVKTLTEKAFASPCKHLWELSCPVKGYFCKLRLRVPFQMH